MIIKCQKIFSMSTQKYCMDVSNSNLTKGKNYFVLEVCYTSNAVDYRIIADDASEFSHPILVRSEDFSIVSGKIPKNWGFVKYNENAALVGPEKWLNLNEWEEDFWEDWCNCTGKAVKSYYEELEIIKATDAELLWTQEYRIEGYWIGFKSKKLKIIASKFYAFKI